MELTKPIFTDSEAQERLRKDIIAMLFHEPFFASIISHTQKRVSTHVPIAGVAIIEGEMILFINKDTYFSYSLYERLFILIHEVLHLVLFHPYRKNDRVHKWWNMATDIAINQMIDTKKTKMPEGVLAVNSWEKSHGVIFPRNLDADHYYNLLKELNKDLGLTEEMKKGTLGKQLSSPSSESGSDQMQKSNEEMHSPSPPKSGENPNPNPTESEESPFDYLHPTWDETDASSNEISEQIVRKAIEEAVAHTNGDVPQYLRNHISELLVSKTNWRSIYRNFIAKKRNTNKKATWKKQNRRLGSNVMGYKKKRKLTVLVGIDTSASINENDYRLFNGELSNMHKSGANIIVAECDAKVHSVYRYSPTQSPSFTGGGGTDFRPVFDLASSHSHKLLTDLPDVIVFLTDGAGPAPTSSIIPTLWCLTPKGRIPFATGMKAIDWGTVIHLTP